MMYLWQCERCKYDNHSVYKFCSMCQAPRYTIPVVSGQTLKAVEGVQCINTKCGRMNPLQAEFCMGCGHPIYQDDKPLKPVSEKARMIENLTKHNNCSLEFFIQNEKSLNGNKRVNERLKAKNIPLRKEGECSFKTVHIQTLKYRPLKFTSCNTSKLWASNPQAILFYEQNSHQSAIKAKFDNGFFSAFYHAYNSHGDVKITPDEVWITIMLYFSKYVTDNAEQLRDAFVSHSGKKKLVVITEHEEEETQWDEFFTLMIKEIKKNTTKGVTEKFQCDFSTTSRFEKIFSTAVIMNAYKKYFDYGRIIVGCGIQNVHFGGSLEDWQKLYQKTEALVQYDVNGGLKKYVKSVTTILAKFIETYQGNVDVKFWNKIMHEEGSRMSGKQPTIDGWLINFFGYYKKTEQVLIDAIDVSIQIDNYNTGIVKDVKMVGGFKAVVKQGQVFRPHLSMAIIDSTSRKKQEEEAEKEMRRNWC